MHKFLFSAVGMLALVGCGQADNPSASTSPNGDATAQPVRAAEVDSIAQVAETFLEAIRSGSSDQATAQLTQLAQQRTKQADMDFTLLANEQASFQVGNVGKLEADVAFVESIWTEPDASGNPQREEWAIALKLDQGEWRIRGIVAHSSAEQSTDTMDFENPGQQFAPANTAGAAQPATNAIPQQASRPSAQEPFRQ